jgi:hypothetical protein
VAHHAARDAAVPTRWVGFYILFVFVVSYLQTFVHVPGREALEVNTSA